MIKRKNSHASTDSSKINTIIRQADVLFVGGSFKVHKQSHPLRKELKEVHGNPGVRSLEENARSFERMICI